MDRQLLHGFIAEILAINIDLQEIVKEQMKKRPMDPALFEKYGQQIDRIYGAAMTLGFTDFGKYAKCMKDVTYLCSQSNFEPSQKKVLRMMIECCELLEKVPSAIMNTEEFKKYSRIFLVEINKAQKLERSDFQEITRKSVA